MELILLLHPLLCCNLNVCIETGEIKGSGTVNTVCTFRIFPISMDIRMSFAVLRPQVGVWVSRASFGHQDMCGILLEWQFAGSN
jgi:hypothetical protein